MCNQSVGLVAAIIEKSGIPTVTVSLLREMTMKVKPPRALFVPFPFGYPLGEPAQPELQHKIIQQTLRLLEQPVAAPVLQDYKG